MQFAQPLWLVAGAAICALLVWQYRRFDRAQRATLAQFAAERLLPNLTSSVSTSRRRLKRSLFTIGVALTFVALARPQVGFEWHETHRKGLELLFAVDTSKSMLAQDVKPDRLTRAKLGVTDLVAKLQGDGVGLVAFAGTAFLQCPVTLDYDAFRESLDALDTRTIPHGGSDLAAAIRESEAVFKTRTSNEKILVLITDGEDLGGEGVAAAEAAAKDGVKIFTVGVGNAAGELVPVSGENGGTDFARDENGELVRSQLDEEALKKIAEATGGIYQPLGSQGEGLAAIYDQGLAEFTRQNLSSREAKVPLERFHWALLAALVCFVADLLIGNRRRSRTTSGLRQATALLALFAGLAGANAATPQSAEEAYRSGDFAKSQEEYAATAAQDPANPELHFNTGSAAYKTGDYARAAAGFQRSLDTEDVPLQQRAYYNLGNTQYRLGQKTEADNPQETIKTWEEAVKSYDAALQIAPGDAEAKHNRDLVKRKIDELKKQQEEQQQQKQDQQEQDQQEQDKQDKSEDQQDQQDQGGKSEDQKSESQDSKGGDQDSKDPQDSSDESKDDAERATDGSENGADKSEDKKGQEQAKNDSGKGYEKKDEANDSQNNAQSGEEQNEQQNQADAESGQGEQPKPVNPAEKPSQGQAEAAHGEDPGDDQLASAAAPEPRVPGEMTTEEAQQLLDALKGDERKVPAISAQGRAGVAPRQQATLKDW